MNYILVLSSELIFGLVICFRGFYLDVILGFGGYIKLILVVVLEVKVVVID